MCGESHAPFGVGYPDNQRWFCRKHAGEVMPEIPENLDKQRLLEIRRKCVKGARLWLDLLVCADNGDQAGCRQIWADIRNVSVEVSDKLKALGAEKAREPTNG